MSAPLRAVVADDSALFRALLVRSLTSLGGVEVVGQAANGGEALELVRKQIPDLLTLDLNMPVLDGLETLRALREAKATCEVIVVSSETRQGATATLEALQLGAVDFITKPAADNAQVSAEALSSELRRQLAIVRMRRDHRRHVGEGRVPSSTLGATPAAKALSARPQSPAAFCPEVVVIGISTGGPSALPVVLGGLPLELELPILIVQHMPPLFTASLAESLDRKCPLRVVEGRNGQLVTKGYVYLAPGGKQFKVKRAFDQSLRLMVTDDPPENHCRPSVDTLFRSVAQEYGGRVLAVIMTGMGNDGVAGLRALKNLGAHIIAQDEATSAVFGMPQEAIRAAVVDDILPLERIAPTIVKLVTQHAH